MKTEILRMLKEAAGYLSGQELCEHFGVSRTAVWKVIRQLEEEGYSIEAVRNKGYRLKDSSDILSKAELESAMEGNFGRHVEYYDTLDSTNLQARRLAEQGAGHGTLVVAESQEAGRGRRGRTWSSKEGEGLYMSLVLRPDILPSSASMMTLVAALAVQKGIRETAGLETVIKWPNDIVAGGRKLCGILTEMSAELEGIHYIVIGIGINVGTTEFPPDVAIGTSILLETGKAVRRSQLAANVMKAMEAYYDLFIACGDMSGLAEEYNSLMADYMEDVRVLDPAGEYRGKALGINPKGELLVEREDGRLERVVSGEVSVRGIYGYV